MRRSLSLAALVGALACRGSTELTVSATGSYTLTAINLEPLPTVRATGDSVLVGGAVLYANGAYAINWLAPSHYFGSREVIAQTDSGRWTSAGSQLRFTSTRGDSSSGAFAAPTLSIRIGGDEWKFMRQ